MASRPPARSPGAAAASRREDGVHVVLTGFGTKIQVIRCPRLTGLGLKEAKDLVEGVPKPLKEGWPRRTPRT